MREATGELNMTYVVVTLVAGLVAFFYFVVWDKLIKPQQTADVGCAAAVCPKKDTDGDGWVQCKDKDGNNLPNKCKYKG